MIDERKWWHLPGDAKVLNLFREAWTVPGTGHPRGPACVFRIVTRTHDDYTSAFRTYLHAAAAALVRLLPVGGSELAEGDKWNFCSLHCSVILEPCGLPMATWQPL